MKGQGEEAVIRFLSFNKYLLNTYYVPRGVKIQVRCLGRWGLHCYTTMYMINVVLKTHILSPLPLQNALEEGNTNIIPNLQMSTSRLGVVKLLACVSRTCVWQS